MIGEMQRKYAVSYNPQIGLALNYANRHPDIEAMKKMEAFLSEVDNHVEDMSPFDAEFEIQSDDNIEKRTILSGEVLYGDEFTAKNNTRLRVG